MSGNLYTNVPLHRLGKLAQYIRGWMNYYGISDYYRPIPLLDQWLRRRLRMCYWKQWRYARTKVRNLLRLGTKLKTAIYVAISRKGHWRLARTLATQTGMTNLWLEKQGLVSIKKLWVNTCPPLADSLSGYDPITFVNRPLRLSASGGDPHEGWCGEGELEAPLYPISRHFFRQGRLQYNDESSMR